MAIGRLNVITTADSLDAAHQINTGAGHNGPATVVSRSASGLNNSGQVAKVVISDVANATAGILRFVDLADWTDDGVTTTTTIWQMSISAAQIALGNDIVIDFPVDANAGVSYRNGLGILSGRVDNVPDAQADVLVVRID